MAPTAPTAPTMDALADDLVAESADLRAVLAPLPEEEWRRATPAAGWSVLDQVSHLAHFDEAALRSATDPAGFRSISSARVDPDEIAEQYRGRSGAAVLAWFDATRAELVAVFRGLDRALRVPWYGPPMSAASSLTARIMETWAHGQDVADALGVVRVPTDRLRHVAHIGVRALPFSFALHGRPTPEMPVRVELTAPSGAGWTWGPADATDRVAGPALDFCLLVTQRRHRDDLALRVEGPLAGEWVEIAQAFAGTPGAGRRAGQFA